MRILLNGQALFGLALVCLSALVYFIHFLIFRDARHIFIYLIGDIAFVFIEVLLVTLVLHQLLRYREKKAMLNKMNMVIGAFFSEIGTELLLIFSSSDASVERVRDKLLPDKEWTDNDFCRAAAALAGYEAGISIDAAKLSRLKTLLLEKRQFLLNLLGNPNLLEHESFTDLLWAVFHLTEELAHRKQIDRLGASDSEHLSNDIKRAYGRLLCEWIVYMRHLKNKYPYLFSLALRLNPFDPNAAVEMK